MSKNSILDQDIDSADFSLQLVPEGEYTLKLIGAENKVSRSGVEYTQMVLQVTDGPIPPGVELSRVGLIYQPIFYPDLPDGDPTDQEARDITRGAARIQTIAKAFDIELGLSIRETVEDKGSFLLGLVEDEKECQALVHVRTSDEYPDANAVREFLPA